MGKEKRVFRIEVGDINDDEIEPYIAKVMAKYKDRGVNPDYFLPIKSRDGVEIDYTQDVFYPPKPTPPPSQLIREGENPYPKDNFLTKIKKWIARK